MAGIIGRIASSVVPWRGIQPPALPGAPAGAPQIVPDVELAGGFEAGPFDEEPTVATASSEEPLAETDSNAAGDNADADLFGADSTDPEANDASTSDADGEASTEPSSDEDNDPFADF